MFGYGLYAYVDTRRTPRQGQEQSCLQTRGVIPSTAEPAQCCCSVWLVLTQLWPFWWRMPRVAWDLLSTAWMHPWGEVGERKLGLPEEVVFEWKCESRMNRLTWEPSVSEKNASNPRQQEAGCSPGGKDQCGPRGESQVARPGCQQA